MERTIFTLRALTKIYEQLKKPAVSIWDTCIGKEVEEQTTKFEVHTRLAGRMRAPLVSKREKGVFIDKQAFEVTTYEPGLIKIYTVNSAEAMLEQQFGQNIYDVAGRDRAIKKELARNLTQLRDIATRTKIWMLLTLLTTGVCPVGDGKSGIKFDKDFAQIKLTSTNTFANADFDIVDWLRDQQLKIYEKTGIEIDSIIMAPDVVKHFLNNKKVQEDQKNVNVNLIQLSEKKQSLNNGMKLVGYLPSLNLTIYSYVDWAKEPGEDEEKQLLPAKTIVGFKAGTFSVHYGAMVLRAKPGEKAKIHIAKEVVRPWYPEDSEDDELQLHSSPLIIPEDSKGYFCAQVVE